MQISIVVPLYNEDESLKELHNWIVQVMKKNNFSYEIIFADDGSTDNSWNVINELSGKNKNVKGFSFRRNYGKSAAMNEAFKIVEGDVVITMDADLQDSPDEIPELYKMIVEDGFDLVSGWKKKRYDPISKTIPTKLYNFVTRKMSKIKLHDFNCGLKSYKKDVVKNIEVYGEMHRYVPVIAKWAGFSKIGEKVVQHRARKYGVTKFGLNRFINGFLDLFSIIFVSKFGKKPMHFFGAWGVLFFFIGTLLTVWILGEKVYYSVLLDEISRPVTEKPSFYLALTSTVIGVQLFVTGFISELLSRFNSEKNSYKIKDKIN